MRLSEIARLPLRERADPRSNPAFRAWFRDSKIVDLEGNPLVCYHGTHGQPISRFNATGSGERGQAFGPGIYFTSWVAGANIYARDHSKGDTREYAEGGHLIPVYLSIQNPLVHGDNMPLGQRLRDMAEAGGHDGIVTLGLPGEFMEIIAFHPSQVKSVFNVGTWSPDTDQISETRPAG